MRQMVRACNRWWGPWQVTWVSCRMALRPVSGINMSEEKLGSNLVQTWYYILYWCENIPWMNSCWGPSFFLPFTGKPSQEWESQRVFFTKTVMALWGDMEATKAQVRCQILRYQRGLAFPQSMLPIANWIYQQKNLPFVRSKGRMSTICFYCHNVPKKVEQPNQYWYFWCLFFIGHSISTTYLTRVDSGLGWSQPEWVYKAVVQE